MPHSLLDPAIGQCGVTANNFRVQGTTSRDKESFTRDSEGRQGHIPKPRKHCKRKRAVDDVPASRPGDLSLCPRWAALRQRILAKSGASLASFEGPVGQGDSH